MRYSLEGERDTENNRSPHNETSIDYNSYLTYKYLTDMVMVSSEGANLSRGDDTASNSNTKDGATIDGLPIGDGRVTL